MKRSPFLVFFLLLLVPFLAYFLRPDFVGYDSYGFLLLTCSQNNVVGAVGVQNLLFSLLPCNFLALKVLLFACCLVSGWFVIKLATLFSPENGWRASYLLFLSSVTVLEFAKFENDQFAFPFLFASVYFLFKGMKTGKRLSYILCFFCLGCAAVLWQGAVFYLIGFTFNIWILAIVSVPILLVYRYKLIGVIVRTWLVAEDLPFQFHTHFVLTFGLFGAVLEPLLLPQAVFYFVLGVASNKFWVLSLPFLAVGMVLLLERLPKLADAKSISLNQLLAVISVFCVAGLAQSVWLNPPTQEDWQAIGFALSLDNNVNNDWDLGYWIKWKGGETDSFQSPARQQPFQRGEIVVSRQGVDCPLLKEFGKVNVFRC